MSQASFYDEVAAYYDLVYADWEESMQRHGFAISNIFQASGIMPGLPVRVLDVCAGIGTQALPLAALGYDVTARDVSRGAIERLGREASERCLTIDTAQADLRRVGKSIDGQFNAIIAFDNSIPHLLSDSEIEAAFSHLSGLLSPKGQLVISVRDYNQVDRSPTSSHPYGVRDRNGRSFRLGQAWRWVDAAHYRTTMIVEEHKAGAWVEVVRAEGQYYAVSVPKLLELMERVGLEARIIEVVPFFQPILVGRAV